MLYHVISFLSYKIVSKSKVMINWSVFLSSYQILTIYDDTEIKYLFRRISF